MLKKLFSLISTKRSVMVFNPFDFSHATTLHITVKKDGTKVFRPNGYSSKVGTPITTIEYES